MSARRAALVMSAAAGLVFPGCRAMGVKPYDPTPVAAAPSLPVPDIVRDHNRNAELVQSLEAMPSVSDGDRRIGSAQGRMALVRPRDFKLTLSRPMGGPIADVGSNDQEFWIWTNQSEEKAIYVGHYGEGGQIPPNLLFQPDWVIEALGLRPIEPDEAGSLSTKKGDSANSLWLVHRRTGPGGEPLVKHTLVDRTTGQILQHDFYAPDGKTRVASAIPSDYQTYSLPTGEGVLLPNRIRLTAMPPGQESFALSFVLGSSVKINQFEEARKASLFAVPEYEGYAVVNLNDQAGTAGGSVTASYDTLPTPRAGNGVQLERPVAMDRRTAPSRVVTDGDPQPLTADLPAGSPDEPGGVDAVVGARIPRPPGGVTEAPRMPAHGIGLNP